MPTTSTTYLNFSNAQYPTNPSTGAAGYGIRDNNGLLEFKNNGGSWQSLQNIVWTLTGIQSSSGTTTFSTGINIPSGCFAVNGVCINGSSGGYWTASGSNIYNNNTGNVGVGTQSPVAKLDVRGVVDITNTAPYAAPTGRMQAGSLVIGDTALNYGGGSNWNANTAGLLMEALDNTEIAVHDAGNRIASLLYYEGGATNRITVGRDMAWGAISTISLNGNVGINTPSPNRKLEIYSGNGDALTIGQDADNTQTIQTYIDGQWATRATYASGCCNGLKIQPDVGWTDIGSGGVFVASPGGNVGIGTQSPSTRLEVNGQIKISGGSPGAGKVLTSDATGLASWTTPSGGLGGSGTAGYVPKFTAATTLGNSLLYDTGTNVGVGTTNPLNKFQVKTGTNQNLAVTGPLSNASGVSINIANDAYSANVPYEIAASETTLGMYGNVGIGTASPGYKLDVSGSGHFTAGPYTEDYFRVNGSGGLYCQAYGGGLFMVDTTWIRTYNNASIWAGTGNIGTNGTLTVGYGGVPGTGTAGGAIFAGNVGIGTQSPTAKLEVAGRIKPGNVTIGAACTPEGALGYDTTAHAPVYCSSGLVWTKISSGSGGGTVSPQTYTYSTPGTYTFQVPPYNTMTVYVWGAGGGGGGTDGACYENYMPLVGDTGGNSSFNSSIIGYGGQGANGNVAAGAGGTASGGAINTTGGAGGTSATGSGPGGTCSNSGPCKGGNGAAQGFGAGGGAGGYATISFPIGKPVGSFIPIFVGAGGAGGTDTCYGTFSGSPGGNGLVKVVIQ